MSENWNISKYLRQSAEAVPDTCALKIPNKADSYTDISFQELDTLSSKTVTLLKSRGIKKGSRVLLMVRPGLDLILITFALFKAGAIPVIIDPGMGLKRFLNCVKHSAPDAQIGIPLAQIVSRVFNRYYINTSIRITAGTRQFIANIEDSEAEAVEANADKDELAAILFTSGSTGAPKGVCCTHGMLSTQVRLIREQYEIKAGEIDLPMLPVFALFNPAMGMTTVVPEINPSKPATVKPEKIVKAIQSCSVTNSFGSPVLWTKIGRYCRDNKLQLPSIKRILMAGAPVPPALVELFQDIIPNGTIHTPYGATEALPISTFSGPEILKTAELSQAGNGTCVGHIFPDTDLKIIENSSDKIEDFKDCKELPLGTRGEIIVKSPVVSKSYDKLPEATASAKIKDDNSIWHRMGDVGYIDDEQRLWFCGRKAELVHTESGPLYTDCCEAVFNQHPDVFRSALIGLESGNTQKPAIVIETEKNKRVNRKKLVKELQEIALKYPHTAMINNFFFEKKFPVDVRHNAKIHRLSLRNKFNDKS